MSITALAPEHIRAISPYQPGKPITALAREMNIPVDRIVKLASNENPLGMSPRARAAVEREIGGLARYPDQHDLIAALAERHGLTMDRVILGNGSNDLLDYIARVFLAPGCSAVYSQYAFAVYPLATQGVGATCIETTAKNYGHDLAAMQAAIQADTRIVWIANPNNPTGTFVPYDELRQFMRAVPKNVIVVLDEAYNEYLPSVQRGNSEPAKNWLDEFHNLIITRTFSKVYGLAGLRIGYALASADIVDLINRLRQPFNVNNLALAAAQAALDDHPFLAESFELNACGIEQIVTGLKRLGLGHIPAHGNFVTFRVNHATAVNQRLLQQGVIVRPLAGYALPEYLRVTVGLESENIRFLDALEKSL
jgi:histidinol-phosphate aminotransferase